VATQDPHPAVEEHPLEVEKGEGHRTWIWLQADYLLWWTRNSRIPPLLTKGESTVPLPGALGAFGTEVVYGDRVDFRDRDGGRFTLGVPLGAEGTFAVEAGYLFLVARAVGPSFTSDGNPVLTRPFFDVIANREDSYLVSYPGLLSGAVAIRSSSFLQGAELNGSATIWQCKQDRVTLLGGFRYLNLNEDLRVTENVAADGGAGVFAGTTIGVSDRFATDNDFYGGQIGVRSEFHFWERFVLELLGKVALGCAHESSTVRGRTVASTAIPLDTPAGLLALASNSGNFTRNTFAVVPELGVNLGLQISDRFTLFAGYTFLYWSDVARPGEQIDRGLNPNLIPTSTGYGTAAGPARPAPGIRATDFYAHGVNLGFVFRY
jgi:hypothetical protein